MGSQALDRIELGLGPAARAYYSVGCAWWTTNPADLGEIPGSGLPCCPYCGSVLMEAVALDFIAAARKNPDHYGEHRLENFARGHHSSGWHALSWMKFESNAPRPFARLPRELSIEKSIRCTACGDEFSEADIEGKRSCPSCSATGVPMAIADDVEVKINWHELRILGIWASNWADHCDEQDPTGGSRAAVEGIVRRLQAQHPNRTPLTLLGEIKQLQEEHPSLEYFKGGRKILGPKKPS